MHRLLENRRDARQAAHEKGGVGMKNGAFSRQCLMAIIAIMLLLPALSTAQSTCNRRGRIIQDTDVYQQVPSYVTGSGWRGERIATLRGNTQVYVCGERNVAFGFSTKTWVQIAFESAGRNWQYGWVLKEYITMASSGYRETTIAAASFPMAVAFAGEPPTGQAKDAWTLGPPPALPPLHSEDKSVSSVKESGSVSLTDLGELYWPLFVAMLLGMLAKAGVDWLDAADSSTMWQHLRNAVVAILVSPIVFLGFLTAGQFSTSTQTFVVLCLLAFQNGFFWQTVLKRNVRGTESNAAPKSSGTQHKGTGH
jgi:hypothetical protein